ncbi:MULTISPECIES: hypothetical protein [Cohnella]|uniref:hypothetical protein n=1 Tax=Cohnella TaxID=329857 RepID=UPI0009BB8C6B|nr:MULTISPECIES: hypothetical protein [Cohnella]MBN2984959.1 hypothetical protein [Cohnella algarum]
MAKGKSDADGSFLFKVDILVHASSGSAALEQLLRGLNGGQFSDFRIESGVQLGMKIEEELAKTVDKTPIAIEPAEKGAKTAKTDKTEKTPLSTESLDSRIRLYIQTNKLIRVRVNKGKGVKLDMPCRIVNFDPEQQLITLYHVDEKRVYSIFLNEIDDFIE